MIIKIKLYIKNIKLILFQLVGKETFLIFIVKLDVLYYKNESSNKNKILIKNIT